MNSFSFVMLLLAFSSTVVAECTESQNEAPINYGIQVQENGVLAGGNHGYMDRVIIRAPIQIEGLQLMAMDLTAGEVAEFWAPIAFNIENGLAVTAISGYRETMKNFELAIYYENKSCKKSVQFLIFGGK